VSETKIFSKRARNVRCATSAGLGALVCALLLGAGSALAQADKPLGNAVLEARARALAKELRCVVCQNQSIDDSTAPLALDLKALLRERIAAGDTDAMAKAFLVQRYGNFVLLKPPLQFNTLLLWGGPLLLLLCSALVGRRYFAARSPSVVAGDAGAAALSQDEERRVADALATKGVA
jgi:cytochrome c-type biogenesis protein CcmH